MTLRKPRDFLLSSQKFNATIAAFGLRVAPAGKRWMVELEDTGEPIAGPYDFKTVAMRKAGDVARDLWRDDCEAANA